MFSEVDAFVGGELDKGLLYIAGKLASGVTMIQAEAGIDAELEKLKSVLVEENELRKVKNKVISAQLFSELNVLNKAMSLATSELMGDPNLVNNEIAFYEEVKASEMQNIAIDIFRKENSNTLYYKAK